ncbi:MAG: efflux RND transporter periplasmic adaptor subunit [Xanthomonadales bacterium]|nr:efflux RND transporter periplasmic adaptor subunit [Xanthomonadales bacterium]
MKADNRWVNALLSVALAVGMTACGSQQAGPQAGAIGPVKVVSTQIEARPWVDTLEALGTVHARESVTLSAKVTEVVERVNFNDGDVVTEGDLLVDLSGRAEIAGLEEAQATYKEAEQQYQRLEGLVSNGTVPRSQLDSQIATRDAARARVAAIRARLADRVITAPFSGVLGFRQVSPGTLLTPGTPIATLDAVDVIKLDFSIPETFIASVAVGQTVRARSAAFAGREFDGKVAAIGSRIDAVTRAVTVRAEIPNADLSLRPGMLLTVRVEKPARQVLALPELAVMQIGTRSSVFRVNAEGKVEDVAVTTGARQGGLVEVVTGLQPGDRVVVEGIVKLRAGAPVVEAETPAPQS